MWLRFIVAKHVFVCHKPDLHRPADKGCRGDVFVPVFPFWKNHSTFNALTSISAGLTPLAGGFVLAQ